MRLNFSLAAPDAAERGLQILGELARELRAGRQLPYAPSSFAARGAK